MLVPTLHRSGEPISGEEFANVAGRAGRAFVDVEGLVVHVMHRGDEWRLDVWRKLVASARSRSRQSGLVQVVHAILLKLSAKGILQRADALEYLANSREPWIAADAPDDESEPLSHLVEKLDATVFGLIEALDADSADLPKLLDEALQGSLWAREISRQEPNIQSWNKAILQTRARIIWASTTPASRRGHFAMGVGLEAGLALDAIADQLAPHIDAADEAALMGDEVGLGNALVALAQRLLVIRPFVPDAKNALPHNWQTLLRQWVSGVDVNIIGPDNMGVIEEVFGYRLVWALEAMRTRRVSLGWSPVIVAGGGAAALETGVPQLMMATLIRAGLPSRRAAMLAVKGGGAAFIDAQGMREWLESKEIAALTDAGNWPTAETDALWKRFREEALSGGLQRLRVGEYVRQLAKDNPRPDNGVYRLEINESDGETSICTPDFRVVSKLQRRLWDPEIGTYSAHLRDADDRVFIKRFGIGRPEWS